MDEERETYTTAPSTAVPEGDSAGKVTRLMRYFTPVDNAYYDVLLGRVSFATWGVLSYLHRQILGYHRDNLRTSVYDIARALDCTRLTVRKALHELAEAHILSMDTGNGGRTQMHTYALCPAEAWRLDALPRSRNDLDAHSARSRNDLARSRNDLVATPTRAENDLVASRGPRRHAARRDPKESISKERVSKEMTDANASGATERATAPASPLPEWIPARVTTDRSELDYWLRAAQAVPGNRRAALLVYLAHEKLGVSDASGGPAYGRLAKLARECGGVGVVVRGVMRAAGEHIDGDALDYLTAMLKRPRTTAPPGGRKPPGPPDVNLGAIPRFSSVDWDAVRAQAAEAEKRKDGA